MQHEHRTTVGRYTVIDTIQALGTLSDGSPGVSYGELGRLERRAAISVLRQAPSITGAELKFARKALGLRQPELAERLGVATETVCRWETGKESFKRQTQLALLCLLESVERYGEDAWVTSAQQPEEAFTLRASAGRHGGPPAP